jgi:hypothetical protein
LPITGISNTNRVGFVGFDISYDECVSMGLCMSLKSSKCYRRFGINCCRRRRTTVLRCREIHVLEVGHIR